MEKFVFACELVHDLLVPLLVGGLLLLIFIAAAPTLTHEHFPAPSGVHNGRMSDG